jgi:glycerol-3-phosphate acyltransferase PlsX
MARTVTIAFDVMGGDHGPAEVVKGAAALSLEAPHIHAMLVGDARQIEEALAQTRHHAERVSVHHASEFVGMDEKPGEALAKKPDASICVAARRVVEGDADALVSAGNTGAGILACARTFKLLPGVRRAALCAVYPTRSTRGEKHDPFALMLDVGATVDASAEDLVAFAVMGSAYARIVSRNAQPAVALLSNGTEPQKGPARVVEAHAKLVQTAGLNFIGNVEGVDIPRGTADVVVCDGFVGNVVLKMLEGVAETAVELARHASRESLRLKAGLGLLAPGIEKLRSVVDWEQYGGAPVLGFDRLFIKAHGRSRGRAIANAGKVAAKAVANDLCNQIQQGLPK